MKHWSDSGESVQSSFFVEYKQLLPKRALWGHGHWTRGYLRTKSPAVLAPNFAAVGWGFYPTMLPNAPASR